MNIRLLRSQTKGTSDCIHFNNAGAALMPDIVSDAVKEYIEHEARYGGYETARAYKEKLDTFYPTVASLIGAEAEEIAFTESATVAWTRAFYSIPLQKGDIILTGKQEYASNFIAFLQIQRQRGIIIKIVPNAPTGEMDITALEEMMCDQVKLIALTHIPTQGGLVNPAEAVGQVAQKYRVLYLLDACQSVGQYPVDVDRIGCDFLSATGRKYLRGPRGTGFLYARRETTQTIEPVPLDLSSATWCGAEEYRVRQDARRFETWEHSPAGKWGLTQAVHYLNTLGIDNVWERVHTLADKLRSLLAGIQGVQLHDQGQVKSGIVSFTLSGQKPGEVMQQLHRAGINVSVTHQSSSLIDMSERNLPSIIRASLHYYNTGEEIDTLITKVQEIAAD